MTRDQAGAEQAGRAPDANRREPRLPERPSGSRESMAAAAAGPNDALFGRLFQEAPLGFMCLDERLRVVMVNAEWTRLLGYSPEEAAGAPFERFVAEETRGDSSFKRIFSEAAAGHKGLELDMVKKDGDAITVSLDAGMAMVPGNGAVITQLILRDITEDKRIEKAMERAKREWERTFDTVPDLVAILDAKHRFVRLNKAMAARIGMDVREAVGKVCHQLVHGSDGPPHYCPHKMMWEDGKEHAVEVLEPRLGGAFMVTASPIRDDQGRLVGSVHVARDITDRKLAEQALQKAHDELEARVNERTAELFLANEQLQEKIRTIDQLYEHVVLAGKAKAIAEHTAEVAHELRQPLTIIGGFARRVAGRLESRLADEADDVVKDFTHIIREVERLEKILRRLIDFNKREAIGLEFTDPNELIRHVVGVNSLRFQEKALHAAEELDAGIGRIRLDPDRFQHVVRNLVANAIEASPQGTTVRIRTKISQPGDKARKTAGLSADSYFVMKIENQGAPIAPVALEQVFNPFFTTKDFGAGLGLTLCKKIVEEHQGSISVKSDQEGTAFTVWLPVS